MTKPLHAPMPKPTENTPIFLHPYLLLVLAPLFWAGNLVAAKLAVGQIDPYLLLLGRWVGAALLATILAAPHLRTDWPAMKSRLPILAFYGMVGFAAFNLLLYGAAHFTSGVNIAIEQAAIPAFVLLGNFILFRVRSRILQILGMVLTITGVAWVATHGQPARILALDINLGDGMMLLACVIYAAYSLTLKYRPAIHWLSFIFITSIFALIASIIFTLAFGGGINTIVSGIPQITPMGYACVLYVMIFPSLLAQLAYANGLSKVGPNRASIFINLLPVFGALLSVAVLSEPLQLFHLVAFVLVIFGIVLSEYAVRASPKA